MAESHHESQWLSETEFLETQEINPQTSSPLFNLIPPEIRTQIFEYAMNNSEYPNPQQLVSPEYVSVQHSHEPAPSPTVRSPFRLNAAARQPAQDNYFLRHRQRIRIVPHGLINGRESTNGYAWMRYDSSGPVTLSISLLLSCRRIYLETHSLPLSQTEHRFFCLRGPPGSVCTDPVKFAAILERPSTVPGLKQKEIVRSVRVFAQQAWLEDAKLRPLMEFSNLEHIRITLRRSDWWNWEKNETLRINPFLGNTWAGPQTIPLMREAMATEAGNVTFGDDVWGLAFVNFVKLRSLKMDFETAYENRDEMEAIVAWAEKWEFPLSSGRILSTEGHAVEKMSWRGFPFDFSDLCDVCGMHNFRHRPQHSCVKCDESARLRDLGYGPQLLVWTVTWRPVTERH